MGITFEKVKHLYRLLQFEKALPRASEEVFVCWSGPAEESLVWDQRIDRLRGTNE
jgi:hypothetical protein